MGGRISFARHALTEQGADNALGVHIAALVGVHDLEQDERMNADGQIESSHFSRRPNRIVRFVMMGMRAGAGGAGEKRAF